MAKSHGYPVTMKRTGNQGAGTSGYKEYERAHEISAGALKPVIPCSSAPAFRGDAARWNPEELLVASLSACHQLWYLHLCSDAAIIVTAYIDHAEGFMEESAGGAGNFTRVVLRPEVTVAEGADMAKARQLHEAAHAKCFIARSVNFPVEHEAKIIAG